MLTCIPSPGTECRIIDNNTCHGFKIGDVVTVLDEDLSCVNYTTGQEYECSLEDLELVESSPLQNMFSKLMSHQ